MAEVAPAPAPAPAKAAKKKVVSKPKKAGPSVAELIVKAVAASKERSGVSAAAVKKSLTAGGYDVEKNNSRVKTAIKSLVTKGTLVQTKGIGASGSFKISKQAVDKPSEWLYVPTCALDGLAACPGCPLPSPYVSWDRLQRPRDPNEDKRY
uniref:Histone H1 n=1 Tax=Cyclopterus lumpus TaxID=8103 RepID=A0A8C2Z5K6_CYCLU